MVKAEQYRGILGGETPYSDQTIKFLELFRRDLVEEIGRVAQDYPLAPGYLPASVGIEQMQKIHQLEHLSSAFNTVTSALESIRKNEESPIQMILEAIVSSPEGPVHINTLGLSARERARRIEESDRFRSRRSTARVLLNALTGE